MSKSLGNTIEPQDIISQERRGDPPAVDGDGRLPRGDPHRQGDPRARGRGVPQAAQHVPVSCAANLYDFDPATDAVATAALEPVDRYILSRYADARARRLRAATTRSTSRASSQALNAFATVDLSAFYVDVSKDRLYTFAAQSASRAPPRR